MPEFTNNFALNVDADTLTESQVIQLLKMQIVKFEDLPPAVKSAVENKLSENADNPSAAALRRGKLNLVKQLGAHLAGKKKQ